ncbi:MAG: FixH family protein [Anaerolineae bacterium]|nr:FixH family protein [Anaerolineae bacterium]
MSQSAIAMDTAPARNRNLRRIGGAVALVIIAAVGFFAYMMIRMNTLPPNLDFSTTRTSEQALFHGSWVSQLEPIAINQIHTWMVHIETPDGRPLEEGQVTVDGGMPQHGHGLPTQPKVTQYLGQGNYRVEGMKFNMPGWWVVNFHITANGHNDTLQFNLMLK